MPNTAASSPPGWHQQVADWYAGGPRPPLTVMREAAKYGISEHQPLSSTDRVQALALAGFTIEEIIQAVPDTSPIVVVDIVDSVPDVALTIVGRHLMGYTPLEMEQIDGITRPKVYYWLKKLNLKPHKRSRDELTARQRNQVVRAYENGEPMTNIARRFNASYDQVRYAVRQAQGA